jgi:hypothetical protein
MKTELIELEAKLQAEKHPRNVKLECQILQLLLNQKMTSFTFPPDLKLTKQHVITELWHSLVAEQPPDLQTIVSRYNGDYTSRKSWNKRPFFNSMLQKFPNLEVLRLDQFACKDADLIKIADHLPKLR